MNNAPSPGPLFDLAASEAAKVGGMDSAAVGKSPALTLARAIAADLCRINGETNADAVGEILAARHGIASLGPAAGSLFKRGFIFTGRRIRSSRKSNHARELKIWRLKRDDE